MPENSIDQNEGDAYIRVYADTWLELEIITLPSTLSRPPTGLPVCSYYWGKYGNKGEEYRAVDMETTFFCDRFRDWCDFHGGGPEFSADTKLVTVGAYRHPPPR